MAVSFALAATAMGAGLIQMAATRIRSEAGQRAAARVFGDISGKIVKPVMPVFADAEDTGAEAVAIELGRTPEHTQQSVIWGFTRHGARRRTIHDLRGCTCECRGWRACARHDVGKPSDVLLTDDCVMSQRSSSLSMISTPPN